MQYEDLYNIPQAAFDNALREEELESDEEMEKEMEIEREGPEFVPADSDDSDEYVKYFCFNFFDEKREKYKIIFEDVLRQQKHL